MRTPNPFPARAAICGVPFREHISAPANAATGTTDAASSIPRHPKPFVFPAEKEWSRHDSNHAPNIPHLDRP